METQIELPQPVETGRKWRTVLAISLGLAGVGLVAVLCRILYWFLHDNAFWVLQLALALCTAAIAWKMASRYQRDWIIPAARLATLIREVRAGQAPTEELNNVQGGLGIIAAEVKVLLRDLRQQKQSISMMQEEMRQKVAARTDALERKAGSLRVQALRDPLTGLHNRRRLDDFLPDMIRQCQNDGTPLSLMMMDVDHFKDLNDTLGHAAGDEMLRSLAQIINSTIRSGDLGFRCGGDEFVVVLPGCPAEAARQVARRLQSLLGGLTRTYKLDRKPGLSIGICSLNEMRDPTAEAMLRHADELLYMDKTSRKSGSGLAETCQHA